MIQICLYIVIFYSMKIILQDAAEKWYKAEMLKWQKELGVIEKI